MKTKTVYSFFFLMATLWAVKAQTPSFESKFSVDQLSKAPVKLIPFPQEAIWGSGTVQLANLQLASPSDLHKDIATELEAILSKANVHLVEKSNQKISFHLNKELHQEGYALKVSEKKIRIEAATEAGQFYALQSLRQLISQSNRSPQIQLCEIKDEPAFPIRGFMIDVGRNFQSISLLKRQLDIMAKYKMNTFHWHLTDRPAWRIESKIYPELIAAENHRPSRNPGEYYTYEEIRDFIHYANKKKINVIPEIDMPGHSESFRKSMGCRMESPEGMKILENVLNEFFKEIPKDLAPIIHIGSDEVRIKNQEEFITKMVNIVESHDRKTMIWSPGLIAKKSVIRQTWGNNSELQGGFDEIDSRFSYINGGEPMSLINRLFFKPIGEDSNNNILGGILCLWPDVNVWSETDIYKQHPVYSALLTYAWATWTADVISSPKSYQTNLPLSNSNAAHYFAAFEHYLIAHKNRYFKNLPFHTMCRAIKIGN